MNNKIEDPYNKLAGEGPIPLKSKTELKSNLSHKFEKEISKLDIELEYKNFMKFININSRTYSPSDNLFNKIAINKYSASSRKYTHKKILSDRY